MAATIDERTYEVFGADERMLELAMDLRGPRRGGCIFVAFTDWRVHWARTVDGPHVCFHAIVTLPVWQPPRRDSSELLDRWTRFRDAVAVHEKGHIEIGLAAAHALTTVLRTAPPRPDTWTDVVHAVVSPYLEMERRYDMETQHGVTQGAVLRPKR